jgi:3-phenylpropionate/cinnamic acid dioxygenase small subunit
MSIEVKEKTAPAATGKAVDIILEERAITQLINLAARLTDDQKFLEWMELFTEDGVYSGMTRENLGSTGLYLFRDVGKRMLHMRAAFQMGLWQAPRGALTHLVANLQIEVEDSETASCVSSFIIARTGELEMTKLYASGRYYDRFQKIDGAWRFKVRDVVVDTNILPAQGTELL